MLVKDVATVLWVSIIMSEKREKVELISVHINRRGERRS